MQRNHKGRKSKTTTHSGHWGMRLGQVLKEHKLSNRSASKIMGIAPSVVDSWVKGATPSDLIAVKKLTDHLKISFSWLLTGEREAGQPKATTTELFEEVPYFDGLARIQIHRLIPRSGS